MKPIILKLHEVQAVLRVATLLVRPVKNQARGADHVRYVENVPMISVKGKPDKNYTGWVAEVDRLHGLLLPLECPFGTPGERRWVKETWRICGDTYFEKESDSTCTGPEDIMFRASPRGEKWDLDWRPAKSLPRWASRLTIENTAVACKRVQDITTHEAIAFGINSDGGDDEHRNRSTKENFAIYWNSIHGPGAWERNDWCWFVGVKKANQ